MLHVGPRNRRRLTASAAALGLVAAIVVGIVLLTRWGSSGRHTSDGSGSGLHYVHYTTRYLPGGDARYNAHSRRLVFGLMKQQVRALVGPPDKVFRYQSLLCWQYQVNAVHSDANGVVYNADRLCFSYGRYSEKFIQWGGTWQPFS